MKQYGICIGINKYAPAYYGNTPNLSGCVNDAVWYYEMLKKHGFALTLILDNHATKSSFIRWITGVADAAMPGDLVTIFQSSHGTSSRNGKKTINGLCFHDGILWDFEYKKLLMMLKKGVNVILVNDCCFSQNNFKAILPNDAQMKFLDFKEIKKALLPSTVDWVTSKNIRCNIIQLASSTELQVSYDLGEHGLFTSCLMKADLSKNYYQVFKQVEKSCYLSGYPQTPTFSVVNGNDIALTYHRFLE